MDIQHLRDAITLLGSRPRPKRSTSLASSSLPLPTRWPRPTASTVRT